MELLSRDNLECIAGACTPEARLLLRLTCRTMLALPKGRVPDVSLALARSGLVDLDDAWQHEETGEWARSELFSRLLAVHGIGQVAARKVVDSIDTMPSRVMSSPFSLGGIPFKTKIALARHFDPYFDVLSKECVLASLDYLSNEGGDTAFPHDTWARKLAWLLGVGLADAGAAVTAAGMQQHGSMLQSATMASAEQSIAACLAALVAPRQASYKPTARLSDDQNAAAELVVRSRISIVTGGPGTGKTTMLKSLLRSLRVEHPILLAPSHCARVRIRQQTGVVARTLQSFIAGNTPARASDTVIMDEASMVDTQQMAEFLCLARGAWRIVLIGDRDQLEPPGSGRPFMDIIASCRVPVAMLTKCFRRDASAAGLSELVGRVLQGDPSLQGLPEDGVTLHQVETTQQATKRVESLVKESRCSRVLCFHTDTSKGINVHKINALCAPDGGLCAGDHVIGRVNNSERGVFNGVQGEIVAVADGLFEVEWLIERNRCWVAPDEIQSAHASSGHQAQGSEFDSVVVVLPLAQSRVDRRWVYTAITRAKLHVHVVAAHSSWEDAVLHDRQRVTLLQFHISRAFLS